MVNRLVFEKHLSQTLLSFQKTVANILARKFNSRKNYLRMYLVNIKDRYLHDNMDHLRFRINPNEQLQILNTNSNNKLKFPCTEKHNGQYKPHKIYCEIIRK